MCISHSVVSDFLRSHGRQPVRLLCPGNSSGKTTAVGCHFLLQEILPTQESNLGLLHCRQILYRLSHQGSPRQLRHFFRARIKPATQGCPHSSSLQASTLPVEPSKDPLCCRNWKTISGLKIRIEVILAFNHQSIHLLISSMSRYTFLVYF